MARKKKGEMTPEELLEAQIKGKQAAVDGPAHEHIVCGILMKKYQNVSLVDLPLSPFDIILVIQNDIGQEIIRAQVRTAQEEIKFTGGTRGGQDKEYRSDVKKYTQNTTTSDVIIGVKAEEINERMQFDLYFVPTILVEALGQKSIKLSRIGILKNNYKVLERCKNKTFILEYCIEKDIISNSK